MIVDSAVAYIQGELKFEAKRYFYDKYNALDTEISTDGFVYTKTDLTKTATHQFKAVTSDYIRKTINDEMVNIAMNSTPLKLLERTGSTPSVLKPINKYWYVRVPTYPVMGETMDIDDGLAQVVIYKALNVLGINKFVQVSKEMEDSYTKTIVIPDPFDTNVEIGFRFSNDGTTWHDSYQSGDTFMAIARDGVWGNGIPIGGSGSSGSGATKFVELTDVQTPLVAGKMLVVNGTADGLIMQDVPTAGSTGVDREGHTDFSLTVADNIVDLSGDKRIFVIDIDGNVQIDFAKIGLDYNVVDGARYDLLIYPNGGTVTFSNDLMMNGIAPINPSALSVMISLISLQYQFFVVGQKEF